ncbi:hypothetical protein MRX96_049221 [Rhipicephalus microplus]
MERFRLNNRSRRDGETLGQFVAALRGLGVGEWLRLRGAARLAAPGPFRLRHQRPHHADATPGASRPLAGRRGKGSAGDRSCGQGRERASTCGRLTVDGSGGEQEGDLVWQVQSLRWRPPPSKCQFAEAECFACGRTGHIARACRGGGRWTDGGSRRRAPVPRQPTAK